MNLVIRKAVNIDISSILTIYNEGILDRIATLEAELKDYSYMEKWFNDHTDRFEVLVAELGGEIAGWASLNRYSPRKAYDGVADLSIYIARAKRGMGIGKALLAELENVAKANDFYKIVLFTFPHNALGQGLYRNLGYREVGVFEKQGVLDDNFVDVMIMEKLMFS